MSHHGGSIRLQDNSPPGLWQRDAARLINNSWGLCVTWLMGAYESHPQKKRLPVFYQTIRTKGLTQCDWTAPYWSGWAQYQITRPDAAWKPGIPLSRSHRNDGNPDLVILHVLPFRATCCSHPQTLKWREHHKTGVKRPESAFLWGGASECNESVRFQSQWAVSLTKEHVRQHWLVL